MFHVSLALTVLALIAGMYLLAKTRTEGLGKLFRFVSYFVIVIAGISLVCQVACAVCMFACHVGICKPSEHCMPGMMHGGMMMHGDGMHSRCGEQGEGCERGGQCAHMNGCYDRDGKKDCSKEGEGKGGCMHNDGDDHEMKKDSAAVK